MYKKRHFIFKIIFSVLLFNSVNLIASDDDDLLNVRPSFILRLAIDEQRRWQVEIPQRPYIIENNAVQIFPGDRLLIEAIVVGNEITKLLVVNELRDLNNTIILEFWQNTYEENSLIHQYMWFNVINPFDRIMEFYAEIQLIGESGFRQYPNKFKIMPKSSVNDMFGGIFISMILHGFILQ